MSKIQAKMELLADALGQVKEVSKESNPVERHQLAKASEDAELGYLAQANPAGAERWRLAKAANTGNSGGIASTGYDSTHLLDKAAALRKLNSALSEMQAMMAVARDSNPQQPKFQRRPLQ